MKTAVQEVFNELEQMYPSLFDVHTEKGRAFVNHFHKFIELEQQQIIEAHGNKQRKSSGVTNYEYTYTGEDYYNEKFNGIKIRK